MKKSHTNQGDLGIMTMQKIMKCGFIGGFILFIWGAAAWTILPWQMNQFKTFSDEKNIRFKIQDSTPESGLYLLPSMKNNDPQEVKKQMAEGPFVFASVMKNGKNTSMVGSTVSSLIVKIIAACLVSWLLFQARLDYNKSVVYVTVIGVLIGFMGTLPYVIWFGFPGMFAISSIIESAFGWFFAGLAMAKVGMKK